MALLALAALLAVAFAASRASASQAVYPPAPPGADPRAWARLSQGQRDAAVRAMDAGPFQPRPRAEIPDVVEQYADQVAAPSTWARPGDPPAMPRIPQSPTRTALPDMTAVEAANRARMLAELRAMKAWAEHLSVYTRATWAGDLVAMRARATALHARNWPVADTARFLTDARALRARIAT